jgi:hypothetical protein
MATTPTSDTGTEARITIEIDTRSYCTAITTKTRKMASNSPP